MKIYQNIEANIRDINKDDLRNTGLIEWNHLPSKKKQKLNNDILNFMGKYKVFI